MRQPNLPPPAPAGSTRYPVSFAQQRLWFLEQLTPGLATYHMPYAMWLRGPLDVACLQQALDAVVARHAVLRTTVAASDGVPEQVVASTGTITLRHAELPSALSERERGEQARVLARTAAVEPFDLARGPLARALLIKAAADEHLLVLTCHHIIGDARSMQVLTIELSRCYQAALLGERSGLAPLTMQYGDYAVWQQERLSGEELRRQLAFWRAHLDGAPPVLELPTVHPRPAVLSYRGQLSVTTLEPQTVHRLRELAQGSDATLFMALLAGFEVVLSRYSRQRDIVVATPVAGRTHAELDGMIGLFINTLPVRTSLTDTSTFVDVLRRVRASVVDALSHQELPFEKLVEELAPQRSLAHAPVCQVQFTFLPEAATVPDLPGIKATADPVFTGTSKFDLTLYAEGRADGAVLLVAEYAVDLFDDAWARRFLSCLRSVLDHVARNPQTWVAHAPMLSADEQRELLARGTGPVADADGALDADAAPDADAGAEQGGVLAALRGSTAIVRAADGEHAMADVWTWAARLARVLRASGVGPDVLVGLHLERGAGMLAAMLGVWMSGGAYVPLDPSFPPGRLSAMATDARLSVIVSHSSLRERAASLAVDAAVVCVDGAAVQAAEPLPAVRVSDRGLAYVIFTSGSTGRPKGVGVEHRAVANLLASFARSLRLSGADRFLAVTTLSFDIAVLELLLAPMCGAELIVASAEQTRDAGELRALIDRVGATAMQATPQTWRLLVASGGVPASLRLRLCGGETLPRDLAEELMSAPATLWNVYGPTETTVWSTAGVVTSGRGVVDIGAPIDHTRAYVLDEWGSPVPVGVVGELYLGGRGVARGYHGQPPLTARQFVPDPWGSEPGARMYRTGDLARWRGGAGLELLGRTDHQVKIRGFRIECGEVEAVLRAHPQVRQAAVVALNRGDDTLLVAYVVLRRARADATDTASTVAELLGAHLRAVLPDYMLPALVVSLHALPLTANGKVDRAALPAPDWGEAVAGERVAPRDEVEQTLANIWTDLLALSTPVGVHDSLFALGGHSLTATRLVARVFDAFGVDLPVHRVFASPTIAALAEAISADPAFGRDEPQSLQATLDSLSDEDLEELLRATLEQRRRRQAARGGA